MEPSGLKSTAPTSGFGFLSVRFSATDERITSIAFSIILRGLNLGVRGMG
jgi:hypothetical protein